MHPYQLLCLLCCSCIYLVPVVLGCGGRLETGDMAILTSPEYPHSAAEKDNTYPSDSDCTWTHRGAPNTLSMMRFLDSRIEIGENNSNESCEFDFVNVTIESVGGRRYCGYKHYEDQIIGLGSVWIHFKSDESVNFRGFKLGYSITPNHDPCEEAERCGPDGRCYSDDKIKPKCRCIPGVTGEFCETDISECRSNPCKNGGKCEETPERRNHYSCDCSIAFLGYHCETARQRPCSSDPCHNGGHCQEKPGWEHECNCLEFFEGDDCRIETGCGNPGLDDIDEFKRYHTGTKVEFTCNKGFEMIGENVTECQRTREWSAPMPRCKEIIIPDPNEGKIFTPFVMVLTVLIGLFLLQSVLLGLWLKLRGPWLPHTKFETPLGSAVDPEMIENTIRTISGSGSVLSDDVFEAAEEDES